MNRPSDSALPSSWYRVLVATLSVLLLAYVCLRSWKLSLTYDEVGAVYFASTFDLTKITSGAGIHLLNALFMAFIHDRGGTSEFAMRLPNTLAFVAYLIAAIELGRGMERRVAIIQFVLLTLNPFVLDFFSLARGYGLGLGAMLPGISFAIRYHRSGRGLWGVASLLAGMISVTASYTMMNFFMPLVLMILAITWVDGRRASLRRKIVFTALVLMLVAAFLGALLPILISLRNNGHLYFGGRWDIYSDTVVSLGRCFGYHTGHSTMSSVFFQIVFIWAALWSLWKSYRAMRERALTPASILAGLMVLALLSAIAQFILMGTYYPIERTALLYCPLMALTVARSLAEFPWRRVRIPALVTTSGYVLQFAATLNFDHCYSWRYDSTSRAVVEHLWDTHTGDIRLGIIYQYSPSLWHYREERHYAELIVTDLTDPWDHCLGLEELNPRYYGNSSCVPHMDSAVMATFLSNHLDVYYLDRYYTDEMDRLGVRYKVLKDLPSSRSRLISNVEF